MGQEGIAMAFCDTRSIGFQRGVRRSGTGYSTSYDTSMMAGRSCNQRPRIAGARWERRGNGRT